MANNPHAEYRRLERERCAKAICKLCRDGIPIETKVTHADFRGYHNLGRARDGYNDYEECAAAAIHSLSEAQS